MLQSLKDISIQRKLMLLTVTSVLTAMSLACTAFVLNDVHMIRRDAAQQLKALADVLGANTSAALAFDDSEAAEQVLASLRLQPLVTSAVIYDANGKVFATFPKNLNRSAEGIVVEPATLGTKTGELDVVQFIQEGQERLGAIRLHGDAEMIWSQLKIYTVIVVIVLAVSFGAALLLSRQLQEIISKPILDLTNTSQKISKENDYRIRAHKHGDDELGTLCDEFNRMLATIEASKRDLELAQMQLEERVEQRTKQLSEANEELNKENAERLRAERQLETVHREFIDAARKAGMAEIATGVLHNVGNVLNSVNVSATMLSNQIKSSKTSQLSQAVKLIDDHRDNLGVYFESDAKGKQIPSFLKMLSEHLENDEQSLLEETRSLMENIDHIKTIISTQQSYATSGGMIEPVDLNILLDDALRLHHMSFGKHGIDLRKDYASLPTVLIDKQRLMQIVINLVKNAKEALTSRSEGERILTIQTREEDGIVKIAVSDTGIGISKEQLEKVFSHGFTTKSSGHGFGLHSCANAATEMDGRLTVHSDGPMLGACFTLELPYRVADATSAAG